MLDLEFDQAMRLVELGLAWAVIQRGQEHLERPEQWLFAVQIGLAVLLLGGWARAEALWALWGCAVWQLHVFRGPYNGGADKMAVLVLTCLGGAHLAEGTVWAEMAMGYLALQVLLSYFVSGWVKLRSHDWLSGMALTNVFAWSIYPVSQSVLDLAARRRLVAVGSWLVIAFELALPLSLLAPVLLAASLCLAACFHLVNAMLFGLNRFFWVWIATYPALFWFQGRLLS